MFKNVTIPTIDLYITIPTYFYGSLSLAISPTKKKI